MSAHLQNNIHNSVSGVPLTSLRIIDVRRIFYLGKKSKLLIKELIKISKIAKFGYEML